VWRTVLNETFESGFPGTSWALYNSPTWGATTSAAHNGTGSVWCGASSLLPAGGYTNDMEAWMVYGPFSLADTKDATVNFWYKNYSEADADYLGCLASTNGADFDYAFYVSGDQNTWRAGSVSLKAAGSLGNLCGNNQVWVAFLFLSDPSICGPTYTGAFLDDVTIQKQIITGVARPRSRTKKK
jgi:hypothetical protein